MVGTIEALQRLVARGESRTLELKRSTAELRPAMQTLCAFANGVPVWVTDAFPESRSRRPAGHRRRRAGHCVTFHLRRLCRGRAPMIHSTWRTA